MKLFSKIAIKNDSIKFKALFSLLGIKLIRLIFEKVFWVCITGLVCSFVYISKTD